MTKTLSIGVAAFVLGFATPALAQSDAAGRIKSVSGTAFIVRQNNSIPAQPGQMVYENDSLQTSGDGFIGLTLKDDTLLSLGPNSEVHLDQFVFSPGEGRLGFALRIARGLVAYVSGRIAKLSPDAVRLETPSGIVGVRGTRLAIRVAP
jgi:hypothetical protein